jgi:hypothetical protein
VGNKSIEVKVETSVSLCVCVCDSYVKSFDDLTGLTIEECPVLSLKLIYTNETFLLSFLNCRMKFSFLYTR